MVDVKRHDTFVEISNSKLVVNTQVIGIPARVTHCVIQKFIQFAALALASNTEQRKGNREQKTDNRNIKDRANRAQSTKNNGQGTKVQGQRTKNTNQ